jgi:ABC-type transport system substrate-binding protein
VRERASKSGKFDYDAPIAGLEVVDRYTLRIRLTQPDLRFLYVFAVPNTAPIAREVVAAYGTDIGAHPVGTGPYMLGEYKRSSKIVLVANPATARRRTCRPVRFPRTRRKSRRRSKAERLPLAGRIEVSVIEEGTGDVARVRQPRARPPRAPALRNSSIRRSRAGKLKPELAAMGVQHRTLLRPNTWWTYFNMDDPVVGGYTPEKIALRRAIGMGYDVGEYIRVILKGRGDSRVEPGPAGHRRIRPGAEDAGAAVRSAAARALLDKFGYKDRDGDGYRETPDGKPLVLERWSAPTTLSRQADEQWKKNMDAIGLRIVFKKDRLPELPQDGASGQDRDAHRRLERRLSRCRELHAALYGPNAGADWRTRRGSALPEFDKLYEAARRLPDSAERTRLFDRMTELVLAYAPWRLQEHRIEDQLAQRWIRNYRPHPIRSEVWRYIDIDPAQRAK